MNCLLKLATVIFIFKSVINKKKFELVYLLSVTLYLYCKCNLATGYEPLPAQK